MPCVDCQYEHLMTQEVLTFLHSQANQSHSQKHSVAACLKRKKLANLCGHLPIQIATCKNITKPESIQLIAGMLT